jgi:glucose dehydrogenase
LLCAHGASAQSPPPASDHAIVEWPVYGGNLASQFYSPLDQINATQREGSQGRVALVSRELRS